MNFEGKRVLVLGLGETGVSMARWLAMERADVCVADTRSAPPGLNQLVAALPGIAVRSGAFSDDTFAGVDLVAISPGVPLADPAVSRAKARGLPVMGDIEIFAHALREGTWPGRRRAAGGSRIISITGTNGKSTVTALAGAMCRSAGVDCEVAGNISPAALEALRQRRESGVDPQAWVLELSSFQLETTETLDATAAVMLNVSEDHLDRYASLQEYAAAKARVYRGQGIQVLNRDDAWSMSMRLPGRRTLTFGLDVPSSDDDFGLIRLDGKPWLAQGTTRLLPVSAMKLAGLHNASNALAALALCRGIGLPMAPLLAALEDFRGLPHRVEFVGELSAGVDGSASGVRFYDDSKGTNVGSTIAALDGLAGAGVAGSRIVLIAGGEGKSQDFTPLGSVVARTARAVVLIGRDAGLIEQALADSGIPMLHADSMDAAVQLAASAAQSGDAVLLSPACASFDMFRNYGHRGEVFRQAVQRVIDAAPR